MIHASLRIPSPCENSQLTTADGLPPPPKTSEDAPHMCPALARQAPFFRRYFFSKRSMQWDLTSFLCLKGKPAKYCVVCLRSNVYRAPPRRTVTPI